MKTRVLLPALLLSSVILLSTKSLTAQSNQQISTTERFIAYSLYNFSKFIDWPSSSSATKFQIAVVGDKLVYDELMKLANNKKVGNATYKIIYCKNIDEIAGYNQIVYLANMYSGKVRELAAQSGSGVLYVTERQGMSKWGSTISFMVNDKGMMGFEIAKENAAKSKLSIRSQLERLASSVI
jgi:hypothetical protein